MSARPINVQRALKYSDEKVWRTLLGMGLILLLFGIAAETAVIDTGRRGPPGWLLLVMGGGASMWSFWRLHNPGKPLLVLSPDGIQLNIIGVKQILIAWPDVQNVGTTDVTLHNPRSLFSTTVSDVPMFEVTRAFYEKYIDVDNGLLRGPGWENTFIAHGDRVQVALHKETLPVKPEVLHAELEARWKAFREPPQGKAPVARSHVRHENPRVVLWTNIGVGVCVILIPLLIGAYRSGWWDDFLERRREARVERAAAEFEEWRKKHDKDQEKSWREFDERTKTWFEAPKKEPDKLTHTPGAGHRGPVIWLAVAADGRSFVSGGVDRSIKLWEAESVRVKRDVGVHKDITRAGQLVGDGTRLLSVADDGEIVLRALADGEIVATFDTRAHGRPSALAVSADGRRAVTSHGSGTLVVWDLEAKSQLKLLNVEGARGVHSVALSRDGASVVAGFAGGMISVVDVEAGSVSRSFRVHHAPKGQRNDVYSIVVMPDGMHAVSGGDDEVVRLFELASGREVASFSGHTGSIYGLAASDDGKRILSGSNDGTARLWEVATARELAKLSFQAGRINAVAFATPGELLTAGSDGSIRLWKPSGQLVRVFAGQPG